MTTQIISFTDAAASHIQKMISKKSGAIGFRLSVKAAGCTGYKYQPEIVEKAYAEDSEWVTTQGFRVFLEPDSIKFITGTIIDYVTKGISQQLVFNNPNVENECGCGESFHIKNETKSEA